MKKLTSRKIVDSGFIYYLVGSTINSVMAIIIMYYFMKFHSSEIWLSGEFSFVFYITGLFSSIGNYGGRIVQISDSKNKYNSIDYVGLRIIASIFMLAISAFFFWLNDYSINRIFLLLVFIIYRAFESVVDSIYGIQQKNNRLIFVGKSILYKSFITLIIFLVIYELSNNLLLASVTFPLLTLIQYIIYDKRKCDEIQPLEYNNINLMKVKAIAFETYPVLIVSFINLGFMNLTRYFSDIRFSANDLTYFSLLILPSSLIFLFAQLIIQPFASTLTTVYNKFGKVKFTSYIRKMALIIVFLGFLSSVLFYFFGPNLMQMIFGVDFSNYAILLFLVILSGTLAGISALLATSLVIIRKYKEQMYSNVFSFSVFLVITILFAKGDMFNLIITYFSGFLIQCVVLTGVFIYYKKNKKQ